MNTYFEQTTFNQEQFLNGDFKNPKEEIEFVECIFSNIEFLASDFKRMRFVDCFFRQCNFNNIPLHSIQFKKVSFIQSKLMGVDFSVMKSYGEFSFDDCLLDFTFFTDMNLKESKFINSKINEASFERANLKGANFSHSELRGTNFNRANLESCDFRGATSYSIDIYNSALEKAKFSSPEVLNLLAPLGIEIE